MFPQLRLSPEAQIKCLQRLADTRVATGASNVIYHLSQFSKTEDKYLARLVRKFIKDFEEAAVKDGDELQKFLSKFEPPAYP